MKTFRYFYCCPYFLKLRLVFLHTGTRINFLSLKNAIWIKHYQNVERKCFDILKIVGNIWIFGQKLYILSQCAFIAKNSSRTTAAEFWPCSIKMDVPQRKPGLLSPKALLKAFGKRHQKTFFLFSPMGNQMKYSFIFRYSFSLSCST